MFPRINQNLIYCIKGTFFKTRIENRSLSLMADFICEYDNTSVILKNRYGTLSKTNEILIRLKYKKDIPYLFDMLDLSDITNNTNSDMFRIFNDRYNRRR